MLVILKIVGVAMILAGSTFIGVVISSSYTKRVNELYDIKSFLTVCETYMNDIGMHTEDILKQSQTHLKTGIKDVIESIYNEMQTEYPDLLAKIWENQVNEHKRKLSISEKEAETLIEIGGFLGSTGLENQKKQIHHIMGIVENSIEEAVELRNKNKKIALNIGVLGGLMITLILV